MATRKVCHPYFCLYSTAALRVKTTFAAATLSLLTSALAIPTPQTTNPYPVSVGNISLKHLIESDGHESTFHVTTRTIDEEATDSVICHTAWNKNGPIPDTIRPAECPYIYDFFLPEGVANIESYQLTGRGPGGDVSALIEQGPKYACGPYEGDIGKN
ncbi:uncharacterized protein BDV17DRAFT_295034 [Aspergillus undulatus]|uniref:uncharacterized protein n=1 Tax=Aspergillus undulatus TaxID=1810928 RepID=UPI003CCE2FC4